MRLSFSTSDLVIEGIPIIGFPIIIQADGFPLAIAQDFFWEIIFHSGCATAKNSWRTYGRDLFDYFSYLEAKKLDWRAKSKSGISPIDQYIAWSLSKKGKRSQQKSTVAQRERLIHRFYSWANRKGLIDDVPLRERSSEPSWNTNWTSEPPRASIEHPQYRKTVKTTRKELTILSVEQGKQAVRELTNETHRLIFRTLIRTGMRNSELRTFPEKYVFDPEKRPDLRVGQHIPVLLDPRDMQTKGGHERIIEVPYSLMSDLWWWSVKERTRRENRSMTPHPTLFLNERGHPYGPTGLDGIFRVLSSRLGYRVHPHKLRHTYATHRLKSLGEDQNFHGDRLLYIQDRLGHSSIETTILYIRHVNLIEGILLSEYNDGLAEIDSSNKD